MEVSLGQQVAALLEYVAWTILWNKYFAIMFLCIGLYLTIGTRFFQIRRFGDIIYNTIGSIFRGKTSNDEDSKKARLSSYAAFATALGSTVGNGNIAGVKFIHARTFYCAACHIN